MEMFIFDEIMCKKTIIAILFPVTFLTGKTFHRLLFVLTVISPKSRKLLCLSNIK